MRQPSRARELARIWWPGLALALAAMVAVAIVAWIDASRSADLMREAGGEPAAHAGRYASLFDLVTPDPVSAAWVLATIGTAEGVAIAIVIVVVVLGVQLTADRYSPRIIDIFVRDPMNAVVLSLFLASILLTIWVSVEVHPDYVPPLGVHLCLALAVADFAILLPYVRYMFSIMRAETIIRALRRRAGADIARASRPGADARPRHSLRDALSQIADIALGSIQEGDTEVCLAAIEALREIIVDEYVPRKQALPEWWFGVDDVDMPGASDQTIAHVDRTRTWVEHSVLSDFLDLIGETPAFRKAVIHAIARATRNIGEAAIAAGDPAVEDLVIRFFNTYLRAAMNQRAPTFAYSTFNEYRLLAVSALETRPDLVLRVAEHLVAYGRSFDAAGMPFIIGTAAEDVAEMAMRASAVDLDRAILLTRVLDRTLTTMAPVAQPIALNGVLKAAIKLALWGLASERTEIWRTVLQAIVAVPPAFTEEALQRMERTVEGVFWEVSDRVVAFDWVEPEYRELIPVLRSELAAASAPPVRPPVRKPRRTAPAAP